MEWQSTYGGPVIFMEATRALSWRGTADSGADYEEACRISDVGASSDSGTALLDEATLLLSEPAPTRVFEATNRFAIVQCIAAASDDIVLPDELPEVDTGMRIAGGANTSWPTPPRTSPTSRGGESSVPSPCLPNATPFTSPASTTRRPSCSSTRPSLPRSERRPAGAREREKTQISRFLARRRACQSDLELPKRFVELLSPPVRAPYSSFFAPQPKKSPSSRFREATRATKRDAQKTEKSDRAADWQAPIPVGKLPRPVGKLPRPVGELPGPVGKLCVRSGRFGRGPGRRSGRAGTPRTRLLGRVTKGTHENHPKTCAPFVGDPLRPYVRLVAA